MKKILLNSMLILVALVFTGCGTKAFLPAGTYEKNGDTASAQDKQYIVKGIFLEREMFTLASTYLNNVIAYPLQIAAEDTLANGHKYFAIALPKEISNTEGIMVNTAPEYLEKCATNNFLKSTVVLVNPCLVAKGALAQPSTGDLVIKMFDTQQENIMTYDAAQVIADLKAKSMYSSKPRYPGQGNWQSDGSMKLMKSGSTAVATN